jgi:hypothetical protein
VDETTKTEFRPPYLAFKTFWTFIDELLAKPLPPKLDRSLMRSKSGSDQASLTAALKAFDLIDDGQVVTGLRDLAEADQEGRLQWLAQQLRLHYPAQVKVSEEHGTEPQLRESFKASFGLESADTTRKSMTFFLHAARTARIEISAHFPTTRSGSGAPGTPKVRRPARRKPPSTQTPVKNEGGGSLTVSGDVYTLAMDSGPVVTFAVQINVMQASVEDRDFIFEIIDKLRGYGKNQPAQSSGSGENAAGSPPQDMEE